MSRTYHSRERTPRQAAADRHADELVKKLGRALRDARRAAGLKQSEIAAMAGISRGRYADLETSGNGSTTVTTLARIVMAAGSELHLYASAASAADRPRDAVHLRTQELVARTASRGGWHAIPEAAIDRMAGASRAADVLLNRRNEWSIHEVWDWFADLGAAFREWDRRLDAVERLAIARMSPTEGPAGRGDAPPRVSGCWLVRATVRNRGLMHEYRHLFRSRFPGSARRWLAALSTRDTMPAEPALLWVSVDGTRLFPSRLG